MVNVTAIILTLNEEEHIEDCLKSIVWCSEIWVVDSGSTDKTLEICKKYTNKIVNSPLTSFSGLRNWALANLEISGDWIFFIDSDERVTPELREEISCILSNESTAADGYFIPRKQFFWNVWLSHGEAWPNYVLRLFRKGKMNYMDYEVHEPVVLDGTSLFLKNFLIHISRSSMEEAITKLNHFTTLDAKRMYRTGEGIYPLHESDSFKKRFLKKCFNILPCKPLVKFVYEYIFSGGFRDGLIGLTWAQLQALYLHVAYFKLWELKNGITSKNSKSQSV